jgi:hypothetical protein
MQGANHECDEEHLARAINGAAGPFDQWPSHAISLRGRIWALRRHADIEQAATFKLDL